MVAPTGTSAFTSTESAMSERINCTLLEEVLLEPEFREFSLGKNYSVNEIYESRVATNKGGDDSLTNPDFGVISYRNKIVGLGDNKYQKTSQNACERVALYTMDALRLGLDPKRVLVVFDGPGFEPWDEDGRHVASATGKMLVRVQGINTCLSCPRSEDEVRSFFREYLRMIIREENQTGQLLLEAV
jgi:hypothetical protein|tara:strand:- start:1393 stop:1953 length:561 start_codon:yes stop_codon:yes gene_type:complete